MTREQTAKRLRAAIARRDLTLAWVARRLGVTRQCVTGALSEPYSDLSEGMIERIESALKPFPEVD